VHSQLPACAFLHPQPGAWPAAHAAAHYDSVPAPASAAAHYSGGSLHACLRHCPWLLVLPLQRPSPVW